jgi:hypothetical protein
VSYDRSRVLQDRIDHLTETTQAWSQRCKTLKDHNDRLIEANHAWSRRCDRLKADLEEMRARKDGAYEERNQVVAAFARAAISLGCKAGIARTAIEGWSEDWHGCVYIDLPSGQVSWHFHDSQAHYFEGLPAYDGEWDGHDTPEKYRRVNTCGWYGKTADDCRPRFADAFVPFFQGLAPQLEEQTKVRQHRHALEDLLEQMVDDNRHNEVDFGVAVGAEFGADDPDEGR